MGHPEPFHLHYVAVGNIAIQKIKHIRRELGLPDDFATSDFFPRFRQYFKL